MSQEIQSYGQHPYAQEALRLAEINRGQPGMSRTSAPVGANLEDSGGMSKPNVNTQPYNNERYLTQGMQQNALTGAISQQANALGQVRKMSAEQSDQEYKNHAFKNQRVAEMIYANSGGGSATFQMGLPEIGNIVKQHVAEQSLMANGINPQVPYASNKFAA